MATLENFATIQDIEAFWKALGHDEKSRAETLLTTASNYLRQIAKNNNIDLDERLTDDENGIYAGSLKLAVMSAVKRAMTTPADLPPVDQYSQSASPYSESMKFTNPSNDLFYKKSELQLLGLSSVSGRSQVSLLRGVR